MEANLDEHVGFPDPILEDDARDFDKVSRESSSVFSLADEVVDGVAELVKHGFGLAVEEEGWVVRGGFAEAEDEGADLILTLTFAGIDEALVERKGANKLDKNIVDLI
jgi:hypothetical protein